MPAAKWGILPASFACCPSFPPIVHPTDADGLLCGVPAPQGVSSLTSGNGNKRLCPCLLPSGLITALTLCDLLLLSQLCPGHVGSWLASFVPSCAPALLGSGCDNGVSCGRGCLAATLESTSVTQARTVRSGPTCLAHPPTQDLTRPFLTPLLSPSAPGASLLL